MTDQATERLCFTVTGEYLTNFCRALALEGKWEEAVTELNASLIGSSRAQCEKVLNGEWTLTGDSSTGVLVNNDTTSGDYVRKLMAFYADGFIHDGVRYIADTKVKTLGPHDHMYVFGGVSDMAPENIYSGKRRRAMMYASKQRDDAIVLQHGDNLVVCFRQLAPGFVSSFDSFDEFMEAKGDTIRLNDWTTVYRAFHEEWPTYNGRYNCGALDSANMDDLIASRYIECEREARLQRTIDNVKAAIEDHVDMDDPSQVVELTVDVKGEMHTVRIPRAPLEKWASERVNSGARCFDDSWEDVSPAGVKMQNDSGAHTDWVIGAGFHPNEFYNTPLGEAVNDAAAGWMYKQESARMNINMTTLANPGLPAYDGTVVHAGIDCEYDVENPILVLPTGGVEYYTTVVTAARKNGGRVVVVLAVNSQLCHLVVNANETKNVTVCYVKNAREVLPNGAEVRVDPKYGEIRIAR